MAGATGPGGDSASRSKLDERQRLLLRAERAKYKLVHPNLGTISKTRAEELWEGRGQVGDLKPFEAVADRVTPEEDQIIQFVWDQMPDYSSWMDAFFIFLNQEPL
jgi:hypothetical protein